MQELTERFIEALHKLHADDDVEPMVELYAEDAQLSKLGQQHHQRGQEGARWFWRTYREVFDEIEATFVHTVRDEDSAVLEWTSTGTLREGGPVSYAGVSVLVGHGSISAFRTYYDSAPFRNDQV